LNSPNPALVTQRAAKPLPRMALLMLCAAYVLPGLLGRDPWKNADITTFGYMMSIAQGHSGWLSPTLGGLPADMALLPYWLGAAFIQLLGPWVGPALAARIPFALLLISVLVLTWYSTYHLARTQAAQPLPFAFGGEAAPVDYARALADGALLALIATLGLLQLGHETTPELAQLASVALYVYALAASPFRGLRVQLAVMTALPALAASGAPSVAVALGVVGGLICYRSSYAKARNFVMWIVASTAFAAALATALGAWGWRVSWPHWLPQDLWETLRLLLWFTWPAWPLAVWTLWRWRSQWLDRHITIPLGCAVVGVVTCIVMGGSDRALMLAAPPMAVLAAFALPTLHRSTSAAIDWFSVCFFSIFAAAIWVVYLSMQTGVPAQPAVNMTRLAPGYVPQFSWWILGLAALASAAWLWLVQWRIGRRTHPLWKSLVLPASGVALCWLLVMTLLLPPLNHARSYKSLMQRLAQKIPPGARVCAPDMPLAQIAALEHAFENSSGFEVDATQPMVSARCNYLLLMNNRHASSTPGPGWQLVSRERRNKSEDEVTLIYRRVPVASLK
jgi:4-amino-4-deoxy-L-arabinose transferase-like glycosyltransferase